VLRDGANYVRQHVQIRAKGEPVELRELVLLELSAPGAEVVGSVDGSPVVAGNFFLAYEHPMSRSAVLPADAPGGSSPDKPAAAGEVKVVRCGYPYSLTVEPGKPLEHTLAIGVVPEGQLRRASSIIWSASARSRIAPSCTTTAGTRSAASSGASGNTASRATSSASSAGRRRSGWS